MDSGRGMNTAISKQDIAPGPQVQVSEDGRKAYLQLGTDAEGVSPTHEEALKLLHDRGIVFGIREGALSALGNGLHGSEKILVAECREPVKGRDGWIEYGFRQDTPSSTETDAKRVDFHNLG